ncbi:hypothetical protein [Chitinivorax sp. B]|uniref:hypothetical protein n=1 Tax=Chitinivorax sp. B TaxID=2502235 RepID=UPI0010F6F801|nr:hypothetical protein [Chitinivorax sp. B]
MKPVVHAIAGMVAMLTVTAFLLATLISELFLDHAAVIAVKHAIVVYGLAILATAMVFTGGSGFSLAAIRKGKLLEKKQQRMSIIGFNGMLIMVPAALFLNHKATVGQFDRVFYAVQGTELIVGLVQLTLMALNLWSGLKLTGRLRQRSAISRRG